MRLLVRGSTSKIPDGHLDRVDSSTYLETYCTIRITVTNISCLSTKAAAEQTIKNLQRENALITSAWYDLSSRLQSNHVVLQRRNDAPRSWLNKQRQLVNG